MVQEEVYQVRRMVGVLLPGRDGGQDVGLRELHDEVILLIGRLVQQLWGDGLLIQSQEAPLEHLDLVLDHVPPVGSHEL